MPVKGDGELLEKLRKDAEDFIKKKMVHVLELLKAVKTVGEIPPRFCDVIMSTSDQMASYILTAVMKTHRQHILTPLNPSFSHYESANPEFYSDVSNHLIYSIQTSNTQGSIPIITALATLLSSRLPNTHELWLINDGVDAIFTADPLIVPDAVPLKCLTAEEAVEMSIGIGTLMMRGKDGVDEGFEEGTEVPVRVYWDEGRRGCFP
ncbi:hypothetical protein BC829DRAFT_447969 [Chytridium lagenaria]|nr:hypothetical protein BC829DRAFT_447969 [Chytridium lagenaria]